MLTPIPEDVPMPLSEWLPPALVGVSFTAFGVLKLDGLRRGVIGGHDRPFAARLCGT
jgi:hypothetical protein